MIKKRVRVVSENGLHARQASLLVQEANRFNSELTLEFKGREASAKSILGVIALGVPGGEEIIIMAEGEDEEDAAGSVKHLISRDFKIEREKRPAVTTIENKK